MITFKSNYIFISILVALLVFATPASSETTPPSWYQVELIVFEPVEPHLTNEKWPVVVEEPAIANAVELTPAPRTKNASAAFQLLRQEEFQLNGVAKRLEQRNTNKVLLHIAWRQPLEENAAGTPVHVHSLPFVARGNISSTGAGLFSGTPAERPDEHFVDGTVTFILSRYLHLKTHLIYYNPDVDLARQIAAGETSSPSVEKFVLKESRRIRLQEIHYLDHPYFGAIVQVTRYEPGK